MVRAVVPDSPAAKAGLEEGDILLRLNISRDVDGKKVEVSIARQDNQPAKIKVTQDGKVSEYTESALDDMPEEIQDIVKPLLEGRLQSRNSAFNCAPALPSVLKNANTVISWTAPLSVRISARRASE